MKIRSCLLLLCTAFLSFAGNAQDKVSYGHTNSWFLLLNRITLSDSWSLTNEIHERTGNFFHDQGQLLIRPSIDYRLHPNVEFSLGYSFIHSWSYTPYLSPLQKNENNLWEQVLLKSDVGRVRFQHRFRQENRWINHIDTQGGEAHITGNDYANRFRYRFTVTFDLFRFSQQDRSIFFNGFDELWFSQRNNLLPRDFARNWLSLGVGFKFNPSMNVQVAYMHQYDKAGASSFISSPIVQFTLVKNFALH